MTSKVLVKLPVVPFSQRKKPPPEIISLPSRSEDSDEVKLHDQGYDKVTQLEQNMKFLQDQHQIVLVSLHQEVEVLRQKNRDLQFQLVFSKGSNSIASSPSSPEDNASSFIKPKQSSPQSVNVTPLQVELLEKDLQDIKISLNDARKRNLYLSEVIEKQKKSLELTEKMKEKQEKHKMTDTAVQVDGMLECQQVELQARLDDAEVLIRRLRQENEEQRKEMANIKSASTYSNSNGNGSRNGSSRNRGSQNAYHNRGQPSDNQGQEESYHKFPPLQTQSYWHRASRGSHSFDHNSQSDYHRNSRHQHQERQEQLEADVDNGVLPQLRNGGVRVDNSSSYPPFYRSRGHHSGGTYYKDERGSRKYRGQKSRSHQDTREYHQEYKEPKENQRPQQQQHQHREYSDSAKGTRDCRNAPRQ